MTKLIKCEICQKEFKSLRSLCPHISSKHSLSSQEYYDRYLKKDKSDGICPICGMPTPYINIVSGYQKHCSIKCSANDIATKIAYKETCQKHYGVSNVSQAQEVKNKKVQTCYKNYNVNNPYQIPSVKEHCIEASKDPKTQEKRAQTNLERYGNICSVQNIQIQQKIQEKMLNQYGVKYYVQTEQFRNQFESTMMKHYGVPNPLMSPEIREKTKSYFLSHYGVEYYTQSDKYHRSARKLYKYDDLSFDSSWEVAVYIYYKAKGVSIQRCPVALKYQYNDTFHYYLPDFLIDGQLVEIKGPQLLDEDYRLKDLYQQGHHFIEAKYKCMCDNNVQIWSLNELKPILEYFQSNFIIKNNNITAIN